MRTNVMEFPLICYHKCMDLFCFILLICMFVIFCLFFVVLIVLFCFVCLFVFVFVIFLFLFFWGGLLFCLFCFNFLLGWVGLLIAHGLFLLVPRLVLCLFVSLTFFSSGSRNRHCNILDPRHFGGACIFRFEVIHIF